MARRGALHLAPTLISLVLLVLVLGCSPSTARPSSDTPTHHHHGHHHDHHHAHRPEEEEPEEVTNPPPTLPNKSLEVGDLDQEDEDDEATVNDADYYFGDDADILTAAAGAVEAHLKAEEEAARRKAGTGIGDEGMSPSDVEDGADNTTSDGSAEGGDLDNSPAKQMEARESQEEAHVERSKKYRISSIKSQILTLLGRGPNPLNSTRSIPLTTPVQRNFIAQMYERISQVQPWTLPDAYTEKVQSFYPSCEVPRNTDEEAWHGPTVMNLLFNLSIPTDVQGSTISIVAAKLRLYKLSQGNGTNDGNMDGCPPIAPIPSPSPSPSTSETEHTDALAMEVVPAADEPMVGPPASPLLGHHSPGSGMLRIPTVALQQDDRRIRVSVYRYTHSLKRHRKAKRKLLDSQMVSIVGQEEWVEFDVRQAAKGWMESGRNFGLVVEVEDEDGAVLPAERYFAAMNCSKEASTSRPFPGFLFDAAREAGGVGTGRGNAGSGPGTKSNGGGMGSGMGGSGRALGLDTHLFPLMDLCTIQYPEGEEAPSLSLLPLSSPSTFSLPFGRRPSLPAPPVPPVVMVACGGVGSTGQRQMVPAIHPGGGRHRHHRRPEEKSSGSNTTKSPEERGNKKKVHDKDDDNDAVATNQLSQRREDGDGQVEDPVVESPSAIQLGRIRHPRRHLDGGHGHRTREGRWALDRERGDAGRDGNEEEEEDEEMREEKVSWQDAEGRQHIKRKVVVRKTILSHREGEAPGEEEPEGERNEGRSVAVMDHRGR